MPASAAWGDEAAAYEEPHGRASKPTPSAVEAGSSLIGGFSTDCPVWHARAVPTSLYINDALALRVQRHSGVVTRRELTNLINFYQSDRRVFLYDVIQILDEATQFSFGVEALPTLKGDFRNLVDGAKLPLILRSAWICPSPQAWTILEGWLYERHSLDGLHTEARLVATLDEAAGLFEADERDAVRNMDGFRHYFST
jgi:hypothetical protein